MTRRPACVPLLALFLLVPACSNDKKKEAGDPAQPASVDREPAPSSLADAALPAVVPPAAADPTADWQVYRNTERGYEVLAPATPPRTTPIPEGTPQEMELFSQEFRFGDCLGQVMIMKYIGEDEFSIEGALDGAITQTVSDLGGATSNMGNESDGGRVARQYDMQATWKGVSIEGLGRGVVTGERTVLVVNAFWKTGDPLGPTLGGTFVKSLKAD